MNIKYIIRNEICISYLFEGINIVRKIIIDNSREDNSLRLEEKFIAFMVFFLCMSVISLGKYNTNKNDNIHKNEVQDIR